jgi:hypothetical protein
MLGELEDLDEATTQNRAIRSTGGQDREPGLEARRGDDSSQRRV